MRILIVGGFARSMVNFRGPLLKVLAARGHEVVACVPNASNEIRSALAGLGARYRHVPLDRTGLSLVGDWRALMSIKNIIRQEKPDRVLAYTVKPVVYCHLAGRFAGNPPVYGMITGLGYSFTGDSYKRWILSILVKRLYREALKSSSGVFFQNPDDQFFFLEQGLIGDNIPRFLINGSGVDLSWYTPSPLPGEPVFLLVARLLAEKGVREYYEAASRLKDRYPQARFQIAGGIDSNPGSILQGELKHWQAQGVIEYLGELDDIRHAYRGASVFVLPSYREGLPRTALEAMAMGRPVITTDAPGCRETVVDGENGFLVPVKNSAILEEAMARFILNSDLVGRMGKKSLKKAVEKYDVQKVNEVILDAMEISR